MFNYTWRYDIQFDKMKIENLEYITQKIKFFGEIYKIEEVARIFFMSLGYDVYHSNQDYHVENKYPSSEIIKVLKEDKKGIPDLVAFKGEDVVFIEVKRVSENGNGSDTLRQTQLKWIQNHPQFKVIIFGLDLSIKRDELEEMRKLEEKCDSYLEDCERLISEMSNLEKENKELKVQVKQSEQRIMYRLNSVFKKIKNLLENSQEEIIEEIIEGVIK